MMMVNREGERVPTFKIEQCEVQMLLLRWAMSHENELFGEKETSEI